jgi:protoporphyrinogen oxidase
VDSSSFSKSKTVICIGAGPAGLASAHALAKKGNPVIVLEADPIYVGGIARTHEHNGFLFDIGGHRFFTQSDVVEEFWKEILPRDFIVRPRRSRILYRNRFFTYPLRAPEVLKNLGIIETIRCGLSYLAGRMSSKTKYSFADWVRQKFGKRLYQTFFEDYTKKVWGLTGEEISADWAQQRINKLSFFRALVSSLLPDKFSSSRDIRSLIKTFKYPRKGPGMFWQAAAEKIKSLGGKIELGARVESLTLLPGGNWRVNYLKNGKRETILADSVISSLPMSDFVKFVEPKPQCANIIAGLQYRDFIMVALMCKGPNVLMDQWVYVNDPEFKVGRIQNFREWSHELIPHPEQNCYGLEYFCTENDDFWNQSNDELVKIAKQELEQTLGIPASSIFDFCVVRQKKAYPIYTHNFQSIVTQVREEIESKYPNLHMVGRNGMHRYNNQDHAIMSGILAAENVMLGKTVHNVWSIGQDGEYLESERRP